MSPIAADHAHDDFDAATPRAGRAPLCEAAGQAFGVSVGRMHSTSPSARTPAAAASWPFPRRAICRRHPLADPQPQRPHRIRPRRYRRCPQGPHRARAVARSLRGPQPPGAVALRRSCFQRVSFPSTPADQVTSPMEIRDETPSDFPATEFLLQAAFGGPYEAALVRYYGANATRSESVLTPHSGDERPKQPRRPLRAVRSEETPGDPRRRDHPARAPGPCPKNSLVHVDATLKLLDPDYDSDTIRPKRIPQRIQLFRQGELGRLILGALREAEGELRTQEIVAVRPGAGGHGEGARKAMGQRVRANLAYLERREKVQQDGTRHSRALGPRLRPACVITQACVARDGVTPHWSRCAAAAFVVAPKGVTL